MKRGEKNRELKERCKAYIKATRSLPEAKKAAERENFSANTSVWLSAFAETLGVTPGGKIRQHFVLVVCLMSADLADRTPYGLVRADVGEMNLPDGPAMQCVTHAAKMELARQARAARSRR